MQPFVGSYVTLVNVHCIVASFLPIYLHLSQKCLFLFKMPIQPLRLVLQQKQPHQQLHLNKVSFKLLKGYVSERLRLVPKRILYASASFVSFKYTPKLWLELQCSVYWLLSDLCHQLDLKNSPRKSVPSSEWRGGESTGLCGSQRYFMPEMWISVKDLFGMNNLDKSIKYQALNGNQKTSCCRTALLVILMWVYDVMELIFTWLQQMELLEVLMSLQVMLNLKRIVVKR